MPATWASNRSCRHPWPHHGLASLHRSCLLSDDALQVHTVQCEELRSTAHSDGCCFFPERSLLSAEPMVMGMQRRTGSPGSEGSTSTAMHQLSGHHMPMPSLYGVAADWTPKKGGVAAGLADSSASPVSVIPKNTRRRPNLAQDAARASPADRRGSTQPAARKANGGHIGSRMMGSLYGSSMQNSAAGVLFCGAVPTYCATEPTSDLTMCTYHPRTCTVVCSSTHLLQ